MAVAPLFVVDFATMKASLRLSGVGSGGDPEELIDEGIRRARVDLWKELGLTRITEILATVYTDAPTTDDEYVRMTANSAEILMVRLHLLKTMPTLFMDSAKTMEVWNEESAFRQSKPSNTEIRKCEFQLEELLQILRAGDADDDASMRFATISPDKAPPLPGESLYRPELDEGVFALLRDEDVDPEDA